MDGTTNGNASTVKVGEPYRQFLEAIRRNTNPYSNTVLLVDDERGIRRKVARDIRAFSSEIVIFEAANGMEAMERLEEIRSKFRKDPLLIVLDLHMPVMDGWEVIRLLRKEYDAQGKVSGIPIVVLSSTSGEKGHLLGKQSVHDGRSGYSPLVTVAKEACIDSSHYDAAGEKGLMAWLSHFVKG